MQCETSTSGLMSMAHQQFNYDMEGNQEPMPAGDMDEEFLADTQDLDISMAEGDDSGVAVSEELRCRYSNKKCPNPRTRKRTGGLHAFCEEHRENANRNQRKLDSKKRVERRQQQSIISYYETVQAAHQLDPTLVVTPPPLAPTAAVEPYPRPIGLLEEDVDVLVSLFGAPDSAEAGADHADHDRFSHYQ